MELWAVSVGIRPDRYAQHENIGRGVLDALYRDKLCTYRLQVHFLKLAQFDFAGEESLSMNWLNQKKYDLMAILHFLYIFYFFYAFFLLHSSLLQYLRHSPSSTLFYIILLLLSFTFFFLRSLQFSPSSTLFYVLSPTIPFTFSFLLSLLHSPS